MKYIVTEDSDSAEEIFIFPKTIHHNDMADAIRYLKRYDSLGEWRRIYREPVSAGFVEGGKCLGYSESLMLGSRPQDTELLNKY